MSRLIHIFGYGICLVAISYFFLIERNSFSWMELDVGAQEELPIDQNQGLKEGISALLILLSICFLFFIFRTSRLLIGKIVPAFLSVFMILTWYFLFWN